MKEGGGRRPRPRRLPGLEYPQDYVFKVNGAGRRRLRRTRDRHRRPAGARGLGRIRVSSGGKYHSVSFVVRLASEDERRVVYEALRLDPRVVYAL